MDVPGDSPSLDSNSQSMTLIAASLAIWTNEAKKKRLPRGKRSCQLSDNLQRRKKGMKGSVSEWTTRLCALRLRASHTSKVTKIIRYDFNYRTRTMANHGFCYFKSLFCDETLAWKSNKKQKLACFLKGAVITKDRLKCG